MMSRRLALATAAAALYAGPAVADNTFDYLSNVATSQYQQVCPGNSCYAEYNGFQYDVGTADQYASYAATAASQSWDAVVYGGDCSSPKGSAYSLINDAWYYLGAPDWQPNQDNGYWGYYNDAYNVTQQVQSNMDSYLSYCN